jgi:hypothetical protein
VLRRLHASVRAPDGLPVSAVLGTAVLDAPHGMPAHGTAAAARADLAVVPAMSDDGAA